MINIRSLLGQVRLHRPDLKDGIIDYYMQESVKRLCRQTMILQEEVNIIVPANTSETIISKSDYDINRVHLVKLQLPNGAFRILEEINIIDMNNKNSEQTDKGTPLCWGFDVLTNKLLLYPKIDKQFTIRVKYSMIPRGEVLEVDFPPDAEEAIVFGCLSEIYMLPGPVMNLQMAKNFGIQYNYEISNLKSIALLGNSGTLTIKSSPLGGRRKNNTYNSYGW